jgi:hypothetical protein
MAGADPGFQVRGIVLKKIAPGGGRREIVWGISCEKITILRQKIIFFPILGGVRPLDPPLHGYTRMQFKDKSHCRFLLLFFFSWKTMGFRHTVYVIY